MLSVFFFFSFISFLVVFSVSYYVSDFREHGGMLGIRTCA